VENVIEFLRDEKTASVTFCQGRYVSRIKKLATKYPDECQIVRENRDGSILAHVPVSWVKVSRPAELSEKQLEAARQNLLKAQSVKAEKGQFHTLDA